MSFEESCKGVLAVISAMGALFAVFLFCLGKDGFKGCGDKDLAGGVHHGEFVLVGFFDFIHAGTRGET